MDKCHGVSKEGNVKSKDGELGKFCRELLFPYSEKIMGWVAVKQVRGKSVLNKIIL